MFLLKCLKDPDDSINIHRYIAITFTSVRTRATTHNQLKLNYNKLLNYGTKYLTTLLICRYFLELSKCVCITTSGLISSHVLTLIEYVVFNLSVHALSIYM